MLKTDVMYSLKAVSERITVVSSTILEQSATEMAQGFKNFPAMFKYVTAKIFAASKLSLLEFTYSAQRKIISCVPMLSKRLANTCEDILFSSLLLR